MTGVIRCWDYSNGTYIQGHDTPLVAKTVESSPAVRETWVDPWVGEIPWRRAWQPTPVFLPGEFLWTEEPGGLQSMRLQRVGHN